MLLKDLVHVGARIEKSDVELLPAEMDQHEFNSDEELTPKNESTLKQIPLFQIHAQRGLQIEEYINTSKLKVYTLKLGRQDKPGTTSTGKSMSKQLSTSNHHNVLKGPTDWWNNFVFYK